MTTNIHPVAAADAVKLGIEVLEARLDNGLRIVVLPDHRAPILTHMLWYQNGAADDTVGKSGIAHFLEHLMFKGTAMNPAGRFSALLGDIGGVENAFTSNDYTAYYQRVPREHLALCMSYEADRMKGLVFAEDVVGPERNVVLEERRMRTDSSPAMILNEALLATLFTSHPYGKPVIGWQHEIEQLSKQDALSYYEQFYTPSNAILVVAGDVEPLDVVDLAKGIYGPIEPFHTAPKRVRPKEPKPATHRRVSLADKKVEQPFYQRLHLVPSYRTALPGEAEALDIAAYLLGGGQTGALFEALVLRDRIAVSVDAFYVGNRLDDGFFGFHAVPAPGVPLERLEKAIETLISTLAKAGFDEAGIARAKTRLVANVVYAEDSQTALARRYGAALSIGSTLADIAAWPDRIEKVAPHTIQAALGAFVFGQGVSGYLEQAGIA